jgi:hypothetical protein
MQKDIGCINNGKKNTGFELNQKIILPQFHGSCSPRKIRVVLRPHKKYFMFKPKME